MCPRALRKGEKSARGAGSVSGLWVTVPLTLVMSSTLKIKQRQIFGVLVFYNPPKAFQTQVCSELNVTQNTYFTICFRIICFPCFVNSRVQNSFSFNLTNHMVFMSQHSRSKLETKYPCLSIKDVRNSEFEILLVPGAYFQISLQTLERYLQEVVNNRMKSVFLHLCFQKT